MKFYQIRHYDRDYPGRTIILGYSGIVLFRYKGKLLVKLKPNKKLDANFQKANELHLDKGYIVCFNNHLLFTPYIATGFIDAFKHLFNIKVKTKNKPENPFV
jgi:hypothetical protein